MTWRRALLGIVLLVPLLLLGAWWWLMHSTSGAGFLFSRASGLLNEQLQAERLQGSLASGLIIEGLEFATPGVAVRVAELHAVAGVDLMPLAVTLSDVRAQDLEITQVGDAPSESATSPEDLLARLRLPLELVVTEAELKGFQWLGRENPEPLVIDHIALAGRWSDKIVIDRLDADIGTLQAGAAGELWLAVPQRHALSIDLEDGQPPIGELLQYSVHIETEGEITDWQFELAARGESRTAGRLNVAASGAGSLSAVDVRSLAIQGPELAAHGEGRLQWEGEFAAEADIDVERANLHRVVEQWPAGHPVAGRARASFADGRIELAETNLTALGTEMRIRGSGSADLDARTVSSDLTWQSLQWPVDAVEPRIASSSGDITLDGRLDDWEVKGELALEAAGLEDGDFRVVGSGDTESAQARIVEGRVLGGLIAGNVAARWKDPLTWSADLDVRDVTPGPIWPAYGGSLSGRVDAQGRLRPLAFSARLEDVRGTVEGLELRADGGVDYADDILVADELLIRHGTTRVSLDGSMQGARGVRFAASTDALENYASGIEGDVEAEGTLRLEKGELIIAAEANSERLAFAGRELADTTMTLSSSGLAQQIRVVTRFDELGIAAGLAGAFEAFSAPYSWEGSIVSFTVDGGEQGNLILGAPAPLLVSVDGAETRAFCVDGPAGARACADASWNRSGDLRVTAKVDQLALNTINRVVDTGYRFDQKLDGDLLLHLSEGSPPTANAALRLSPGRIVGAEQSDLAVTTGEGSVSLEIQDGELLAGELDLPMPGTGVVHGELRVLDVNDLPKSGIEGNLRVQVDDIEFVRVFVPTLDRARGQVHADIELGGTVATPHASGEILLENGNLGYRPLGLDLEELQLRSTFDADRRFELEGSFRAGEGTGRLTSAGDYALLAESGIEVELTGQNLTLINVPDVQAVADADMRIGVRDNILRIDGWVTIPSARVSPESLPATRKSESDDVVIVAGEQPDTVEAAPPSPLRIAGDLDVTLGEDVVVDLDVAEAKVGGSVRFEWREQLMPIANGRYTVTGDVEAYGQVLEITEGTIRFSKVPANNPTLRIRAEREIFGNSQIKVAGVLIDGTAKRPRIEPYTEPRTTEERALTLLVTGSDFDLEQGVGAIDFGTYIAPKLFVSYGVGLFDQENVISARYDLGKGFGVKATSGQSESGFDLIYRIER